MSRRSQILCLLMIFLCAAISGVSAQRKTDSLLQLLKTSKADTVRVNIVNQLAVAFSTIDHARALRYSEEGLNLATKLNYKNGMATSLMNTGLIWYRQQLYENALTSYNKSLEIFKNAGNTIGLIHCYNSIGHLYMIQEKYQKAMEFYLKSTHQAESLNNRKEIANCYINVANVLNAQGDYKNAIRYLWKSLKIFEESSDKYNMGVCYNNMAANYIDQDSLVQALGYLGKSLQIYIELKDQRGQAACYLNMGIVSDKRHEYKNAIRNYLSALEINETLNDKYRITTCLANLSISYLNLKNYEAATATCERGLKIAREINVFDAQRIFYKSLSQIHDSLGNFKKAYDYYKLFKQADDSVFSSDKRKQVLEMEIKYQSEKKEIEISNLTKDVKLQAIRLENNRNFQIFLVVISILVLFLLIVFYRLYKLKLNTSRLLEQKNDELELMNRTLSESEAALKELNATKDKFFTIIAHDIKNPLSAFRSVTKALSISFYELSEQQKLAYIHGIHKSSENLFNLFQNLLQWSTSQAGSMKFKPQELDLGIIAFKAGTALQESADKKNIQLEINIKADTYAFGDTNMVSTVFVNLLSNAIKYTQPGGSVWVDATDYGDYMKVSVVDNGIGMTKEDIEKLFRVDVDFKTIGNSEEKGTGIGLILCKEFVSRNGGEIWVESESGKGSSFHFTLPKELGQYIPPLTTDS